MRCPKCASVIAEDEAAAGTCPVCGEVVRNLSVQGGAPSSAQNRRLGLFLCCAGSACFLFAWWAFRFGGAITVGIGLIGAMLFVLGLVGIISGRLPLEFLDRFFGN
jgi:hypothetical protein